MNTSRTLLLLLVSSCLTLAGRGQDTPVSIGPFDSHGSITAGYRFTDVAGRREKFDELFSLRSGFRVHDIQWVARSTDEGSFADTIAFSASGIGGDPYSHTRLEFTKNGKWEADLSFRRSYYYWDRNDDALQPTGQNGLTSNHDYATVRRFGDARFSLYATPDLKLNFEYRRTERDGNRLSTRSLEYFDPISGWGRFARANPYPIEGPADETSNRFAAGFSWSPDSWGFSYTAGYQRYSEELLANTLTSPQLSINVDDPLTASEAVDIAQWTESRRVSAPFSEFSYNGRLRPNLEIHGGYIYYRYRGPSHVNAQFEGAARVDSQGTAFAPFDVVTSIDADLREPTHVIDQGLTWDIGDRLAAHADYRYSRFTIANDVRLASTDADGPASESEELRWEQGLHSLDVSVEFVPYDNLLIRPGVRLTKRDVTFTEDGVAEPQASRRSKVTSPILSVYYRPLPTLTLSGDVRNTTNGGPYTRVTARTDFGGRWVVTYRPTPQLSMENAFRFRNSDYTTSNYENSIRLNSTTVRFQLAEDLALTGGFTYDSYIATAAVEFIRGTEPRDVIWRDQTVSRVWQAGVDVSPRPWARLRLSGNYVRTTGAGEISGELPKFGPLTWPMVTGTAEFDVPRAGTLAIDLQRTYYIEEIVRGNDFSANMLGLRWIVDF